MWPAMMAIGRLPPRKRRIATYGVAAVVFGGAIYAAATWNLLGGALFGVVGVLLVTFGYVVTRDV